MELGRFKVTGEVGSGSHSIVYLANDGSSRLAIKRVDMSRLSEEDKEHAQDEASLLSKLKHPCIVDYREAFMLNDKQLLCICMEYCDQGDLYSLIQRTMQRKAKSLTVSKHLIDEGVCLDWLVQLSFALEYLHSNNILHRDVKPQNVFLSRPFKEFNSDGSAKYLVKLGDFGVAKQLENRRDLTTTQIGTPFNMSPEVFTQSPYSFKTDVWSLACVIAECYQGSPPFDACSFLSLRSRVLNDSPKLVNPNQPLSVLLSKMLNKDARGRPSARDVLRSAIVSPQIPLVLESFASASGSHLTAIVNQLIGLNLQSLIPADAFALAHKTELKGARRALPRSLGS